MWLVATVTLLLPHLIHALPIEPNDVASPSTPREDGADCEPQVLDKMPHRLPDNANHLEAMATKAARALSSLVEQKAATEEKAAVVARVSTKGLPPGSAIALGAPQLGLGLLMFVNPYKLIIFQRNNSKILTQYWKALASPWNGNTSIWSKIFRTCSESSWTRGIAVAFGTAFNRAAAAIFVPLDSIPCDAKLYRYFGGTPMCDQTSTECETSGLLKDDNGTDYRCRCADGFYRDSPTEWSYGSEISKSETILTCTPCAGFCGTGVGHVLLAVDVLGACFAATVAGFILWKRKCKAISITMWPLPCISATGACLMYLSGAAGHAEEKTTSCGIAIVLRGLGFVACYGCVGLRLWCVLGEFRTRAAHRYRPRTADVLKGLGAMLAAALCYTLAGLASNACPGTAWYHVTGAAEVLLLAVGLKLAHSARNANVLFHEREFLSAALSLETISIFFWRSAAAISNRAAPELSSDVGSIRTQMSATLAIFTICLPKLWYARSSASTSSMDSSRRGVGAGDVFPAVEEGSEPSASETRAELKRLYLQYEIIRAISMRKGNPHVHRRKRRRFSLQALTARRGRNNRNDADPSRTPEDSVCSIEGPSLFTDGDPNA